MRFKVSNTTTATTIWRGPLSSKIQPWSKMEFTHCNIIFSRGFLCDEWNGLQLQTKEYDWTRRWFTSQQVDVVWYTSIWHSFVVVDDITGIGWLHRNGKNYWLYTCQWICTVYVNERQYRIHNFISPYINDITPRIQWSFIIM